MDTLEFLQQVLPSDSPTYYLAILGSDNYFKHKSVGSLERMARLVERYEDDIQPGQAVYFACSGYKQDCIVVEKDGKERKAFRTDSNWYGASSLWVDIDVKPGKPECYDSFEAASKDFIRLLQQYKLPAPLLVGSGNGLHLYWLLDATVTNLAEWKSYAVLLRSVLHGIGLKFDQPKTTDPKAVLRPIGSFHRKDPANPKRVRRFASKLAVNRVNAEEFAAKLKEIADQIGVTYRKVSAFDLLEVPAWAKCDTTQNALYQHRHVDAERIASGCQQIRSFAESGGNVSYDVWYLTLGVLKFADNGYEVGKQWSQQHPTYSDAEYDKQFNALNGKPTRCVKFDEKGAPDGCKGCVYRGKINSPIALGYSNQTEPVALPEDDAKRISDDTPTLLPSYQFVDGKMWRKLKDKDTGEDVWEPFCSGFLYPLGRERDANDEFSTTWRLIPPHKDDKAVDFYIPVWMLNSKRDLLKRLGEVEIILMEREQFHMGAYLRDTINNLRETAKARHCRSHFGWQQDGTFLYGNELYSKDGTHQVVNLSSDLSPFMSSFFTPPKGSLDLYLRTLHSVYNRATMEPFQYVFFNTFGSLLNPLVGDNYNGVLLALAGADSGRGKTSVCKAAMYAFGDVSNASGCMIVGDGRGQGATQNARVLMMAKLKNFCLILDEFSNTEPDDLRQLCYEFANGSSKAYATKDRNLVTGMTFQMSPVITGNADYRERIQVNKAKAAAESVRLIQIYIDQYNTVDFVKEGLGVDYVKEQVDEMSRHTGWLGREFVKFVVANQDVVRDLITKYTKNCAVVANMPALRFYRYQVACTLTAAAVLIEHLKLIEFDLPVLEKFAMKLLLVNCTEVAGAVTTDYKEMWAQMMNLFSGKMYHTRDYKDARVGVAETVPQFRDPVVGRYVYGAESTTNKDMIGKVILSVAAFNEFCSGNNLNRKAFASWLEDNKIVIGHDRYDIARGTTAPRQLVRAYMMDSEAPALEGITIPPPNSVYEAG